MDPAFYNSGDPELKDFLGQLIMLNTVSCDSVKFSYSKSVTAFIISDNNKILMNNFVTPVNGATTSGDYL